MRFDRFTERAQDAATRAYEIVRRYGHTQVDTEHVFLALLEQQDGAVPQILVALNIEGATDFVLDVGDQRVLNRPNAAIGDLGVSPGIMSILGIDGDTNDLDAALLKLLKAVVKGNQFGWADKGKVERIEKDNRGLPLDIAAQVEVFDDLTIAQHGGCGEIRG